jgi:hypothetical protein
LGLWISCTLINQKKKNILNKHIILKTRIKRKINLRQKTIEQKKTNERKKTPKKKKEKKPSLMVVRELTSLSYKLLLAKEEGGGKYQ